MGEVDHDDVPKDGSPQTLSPDETFHGSSEMTGEIVPGEDEAGDVLDPVAVPEPLVVEAEIHARSLNDWEEKGRRQRGTKV